MKKLTNLLSFLQVESYWDECLALPSKLKDWDAYNDLKSKLQTYLEVFPLLHSLAAKVRYHVYPCFLFTNSNELAFHSFVVDLFGTVFGCVIHCSKPLPNRMFVLTDMYSVFFYPKYQTVWTCLLKSLPLRVFSD